MAAVKSLDFQKENLTIGKGELLENQISSIKDIQSILNGYTYIECKEILDRVNKDLQYMAIVVMPELDD